jgi:cytochrome b pre-mRNA-processing protein 3
MIFQRLLGRKARPVETLYSAIVTAARQHRFYAEWGVPDTVDGRFEMIVLHLFLVLDRLLGEKDHEQLAQALTDQFFADMDRSLREMGVGDLSVGKKVRKMAEAYYGRVTAYGKAIDGAGHEFELALARNVFASEPQPAGVAPLSAWAKKVRTGLRTQSAQGIAAGEIRWS